MMSASILFISGGQGAFMARPAPAHKVVSGCLQPMAGEDLRGWHIRED